MEASDINKPISSYWPTQTFGLSIDEEKAKQRVLEWLQEIIDSLKENNIDFIGNRRFKSCLGHPIIYAVTSEIPEAIPILIKAGFSFQDLVYNHIRTWTVSEYISHRIETNPGKLQDTTVTFVMPYL
jgi:hypothetical protein